MGLQANFNNWTVVTLSEFSFAQHGDECSLAHQLPSGGTEKEVWSSYRYTDWKGLVTFDAGGTVTVQMLPMRSFFAGSQKNGIESLE
ncbi:MAG TPA: hypothetical protein DD633_01465 [Sphaerochaeta sp.]|nr:hypothetical protein [Sphaerochaeta sp.]